MCFITRKTPINLVIDSDILYRVSFDSLIPLRISDCFTFSTSETYLFCPDIDNLFLVCALNFRMFLNYSYVSLLCLNPNEEPAICNML